MTLVYQDADNMTVRWSCLQQVCYCVQLNGKSVASCKSVAVCYKYVIIYIDRNCSKHTPTELQSNWLCLQALLLVVSSAESALVSYLLTGLLGRYVMASQSCTNPLLSYLSFLAVVIRCVICGIPHKFPSWCQAQPTTHPAIFVLSHLFQLSPSSFSWPLPSK